MKNEQKTTRRIGIYAGSFDPVHAGHISFALQAMERAGLDTLYFLPEWRPRYKSGVEHFGHRVAMLRRAVRPHPKFAVLELPDINFSVERTLPRLKDRFGDAQLVFLFGSDALRYIAQWPLAERLLEGSELVIGTRENDTLEQTEGMLTALPWQPKSSQIISSSAPTVSSSQVRAALRRRQYVQGLLRSVQRYSDNHWLYVSIA